MPPLYTLSFQRSQLENAYLCVDDDDLLFMRDVYKRQAYTSFSAQPTRSKRS